MPPITQPLHVVRHRSLAVSQTCPLAHVLEPGTQRAIAESQVSTPLHDTPSEQLRVDPAHVAPALHASPTVQKSWSLHEAPVFAVHALVEVAGAQTWQGLLGFVVIGA